MILKGFLLRPFLPKRPAFAYVPQSFYASLKKRRSSGRVKEPQGLISILRRKSQGNILCTVRNAKLLL